MARPKGARNRPKPIVVTQLGKVAQVKEVKYLRPKDLGRYELKRLYWYLLAIEKKIMIDPTSVSPARYKEALKNYTDAIREYENVDKTVDKKRPIDRRTDQGRSRGVSQDGQADLGARVPAVNPIT